MPNLCKITSDNNNKKKKMRRNPDFFYKIHSRKTALG